MLRRALPFLIFFLLNASLYGYLADDRITRGARPGEIYFISTITTGSAEGYGGVFYSPDNGEHIVLMSTYPVNEEDFPINEVYGDPREDTVFARLGPTLIRSDDNGHTWTSLLELPYTHDYVAGAVEGELYAKPYTNPDDSCLLYYITDFGNHFVATPDSVYIKCLLDVGLEPGEIYAYQTNPPVYDEAYICFSNDYGSHFEYLPFDHNLFYNNSPHFFSRGVSEGELFFVRMYDGWELSRSTNHGQDFTYLGTFPFEFSVERETFSAGREEGSFYILEEMLYVVKITYVQNYGATYTSFIHQIYPNWQNPLIASFSASPVEGDQPLAVAFTDSSIGLIDSWNWDFDNDGVVDSDEQNPIYIYFEPGTYTVSLTVTDSNGTDTKTVENMIHVNPVGVNDETVSFLRDIGNYPNPFNPETTIEFSLLRASKVNVSVYNQRGQLVRNFGTELRQPGLQNVLWNGRDDRGNPAASGVYMYRIATDRDIITGKMALMK